ncbi:MAG: hypothetical protein WCX12_01130 [Candidatus Paceibacterota bacterium]|jgi:hypothetical protein
MYKTPKEVNGLELTTWPATVTVYQFTGSGSSFTTSTRDVMAGTAVLLTGNVRFCTKGMNVEVLAGIKLHSQGETSKEEYFIDPHTIRE